MLNSGFSPWPFFDEAQQKAVLEVLRTGRVNYWTGTEGRSFEREFAAWTGTRHAIALSNGTVALDAIWKALGIGPGDEVICTPRTFQASASSIAMCGARPVFADVDRESQNITPETVAPLISARTRAILCVHLGGWPCDMDGFRALSEEKSLHLVEDCAQAHGASIGGRNVGTFGIANAWSFCQDKIITTGGEGGAITLDDEGLWKQLWSWKDHGKDWDAANGPVHAQGFRWLHDHWGTNARMTEMEATIGRIQLAMMPDWHAARTRNATALGQSFATLSALRVPEVSDGITHAWYRFYAFVRPEALKSGWDRDRIMAAVKDAGVPCLSGTCPEVYLEKSFERAGLQPAQRLPVAAELGQTSLAFLVHPTLTEAEIGKTVDVVGRVMAEAQR